MSKTLIYHDIEYEPDTGKFYRKGVLINTKHNGDGYLRIMVNTIRYKAHRLAWFMYFGYWPQFQIDHINRIKSDNRIVNLREADNSINMHNREAKGIKRNGNKWAARITISKQQIHLGIFATEIEAKEAYKKAKELYWQNLGLKLD